MTQLVYILQGNGTLQPGAGDRNEGSAEFTMVEMRANGNQADVVGYVHLQKEGTQTPIVRYKVARKGPES